MRKAYLLARGVLIGIFMLTIFHLGTMNWEISSEQPIFHDSPKFAQSNPLTPTNGVLQTANNSIFWFLHITDTQNMWYHPERREWFRTFLTDVKNTIDPVLILNTGDLVDSDYSGFFKVHLGQRIEEWQTYASILNETSMNSSFYFDVLGNHDTYGDPGYTHFRQYSMQKEPYYDFVVNPGFGDYHFIGLNMPEDHGIKYPFSLFAYLNKTELDWYEQQLNAHRNANLTITFGHMPAYEVMQGQSRYFALNRDYNVDLYLCGHDHQFNHEMVDGRMPSYGTGHLTDGYRIVAVDNDVISTGVQMKNQWPAGVITSPVDVRNINPGLKTEVLTDIDSVRVLAWDPDGVVSVEWRATMEKKDVSTYSGWIPLTNVEGPLYNAPWNSALADGKSHIIQTRIVNINGSETIQEIEYRSAPKTFFTWGHKRALITVAFFGAVLGSPTIRYGLRQTGKIAPKRHDQQVDPKIRNLILLKLLLFLCVPLTVADIFPDTITMVFSWIYAGSFGLRWYMNNMMFSTLTLLFGIYFPSWYMSPRKRFWMVLWVLPLSMGTTVFMIWWYIYTVSPWAWISPGYYTLLLLDVLLYRRSIQLINQNRS
jgi:predicted MPP superfamily phosphohydrolase